MEFDRSIALVQGCLLAPPPVETRADLSISEVKPVTQASPLPRLLSVFKQLDKINIHQIDDVNRRIHLFLLINTDFSWTCDLLNNEGFSSLVDIIPRLDPNVYIEAVRHRNLWKYLIEALQHLPLDESRQLWSLATGCLGRHEGNVKVEEWMAKITGITCAAIVAASKAPGKEANESIEAAIKVFAENVLKPKYIKDKSVIMANVLIVLRLLLDLGNNSQKVKIIQISEETESLYCFTKNTQPSTCLDITGVLDVVLAIFKTLVVDLSLDTWMEWCEISSGDIVCYKDWLEYWSDGEPPSNMQLLVAHLQAQCRQLLVEREEKTALVKEMATVMKSTANFYDRKVELNMDEMELVEMMEKVQILDGWKQKAFVDHILDENLEESLENEDYVKYLLENPALLSDKIEKIIKVLMEKDHIKENQKALINKLVLTLPKDDVTGILQRHVAQHGMTCKLRTSCFDQRFVSCLNKGVSTESDTHLDVIQFLSLALQDPKGIVNELLEQAANNKGKVDIVAKILIELDMVCCLLVDNRSLFSSLLMNHLEGETSTVASKQNCAQVLVKVSNSEIKYGVEIMQRIVSLFWTQFSCGNFGKCVEVGGYLADLVHNTKTLSEMDKVDVECLVGVLVGILNVVVDIDRMEVANTCRLRELCLSLLKIIFKKSSEMKKAFEEAFNMKCRGYFFSGTGLKMNIHAHYFNVPQQKKGYIEEMSNLSDDLLKFQIVECLPNLLKSEWHILYNLLVEINCSKSSEMNDDLEVTLQAEEINQVSVCLLDSLSTLLNNSNLSLDLQKHMVLSVSAVLSQAATTLTISSCHQLLDHLVMTQHLVPAVVSDDLLTCQHSVLAVLLNHQELTKENLEEIVGLISCQPPSDARAMGLKMVQQMMKDKPGKLLATA